MTELFRSESEHLFTIKGYIKTDYNDEDDEVIIKIFKLLNNVPDLGTINGMNIYDVKVRRRKN